MINIKLETESILSAQDRYDIINFAMEAADDNGFINSFIFERALYCYAAIMLYPERRDEIAELMLENPLIGWSTLLEDGTIFKMQEDYDEILKILTNEAAIWFDEYADWAHSARGILNVVEQYTGGIVQSAARKLQSTAQETGVTELLEIAEDWGMNRQIAAPEIEVQYKERPTDSLFTR